MSALRAVIVDDEIEGINTLEYMLREYCPDVEIMATFQSSIEALKSIKANNPDLLFLDIKMPHLNGLELLQLVNNPSCKAIFTTAYDEYVLQALRLSAIDYLKKPIEKEELIAAVEKVKVQEKMYHEQIQKAIEYIDSNSEITPQTPFGIKEGNKIKFVKLLDISCCKSDGNFTKVYLNDGTSIYASLSLGFIEERLPEKYFFRPHREYIINGYQIMEYDKSEGGSINMNGNIRVPVSRTRKEDLKEFIERF